MIYISTRDDLTNEDRIGPTTFWDLTVTNQVLSLVSEIPSLDEVAEKLEGKSVLILIHGYNNEFEDIIRAYDIIERMVGRHLSDWYDEVIGFTWPGGDNPLDWYEPKRRAGAVAPRLAEVIRHLVPVLGSIDIMSHSLGGRVALAALTAVPQDAIRANFLTASAVDNEILEPGQKYHISVKLGARESVVFHSKNDLVLKTAYRVAEWDNPLGLFGPENPGELIESLPDVFVANCKRHVNDHGGYKSSHAVFEFINHWLSGRIGRQFSTL